MRLDRFLKVSRLIKRRTLAKEVCDQGRVLLNGRVAKAASEVEVGDRLTINFGTRTMTVEVAAIKENARVEEASQMYQILGPEGTLRP
ncbi:MAG: RNA-binding S4 domain-containing protein [Firmicutes bacterium]|nr:RNA-binding S4 domain-containing protein [Bacillota bacterium]MCL5040217.1 RNA-binding S4 domain-containing protein [Bacillota bacterium]